MNKDYLILEEIKETIERNSSFLNKLLCDKENFVNDFKSIAFCIGLITTLSFFFDNLGTTIYLNQKLFNSINSLSLYYKNDIFSKKIFNAYKLFDVFTLEIPKLLDTLTDLSL